MWDFIAKETRKIFQSYKIILETYSGGGDRYVKEEFFDGFFENIHFECEINSQNGFRIYSCIYRKHWEQQCKFYYTAVKNSDYV